MASDDFTRDLHVMLESRVSSTPSSLRVNVLSVTTRRRRSGLLSALRSAAQLSGTGLVAVAVVLSVGGVLSFGLAAGGNDAATRVGTGASPSGKPYCGQAIRLAVVGHTDSTVTFADPDTGGLEKLVFPSGFSTRVVGGSAQLSSRDRLILGTDGDVLTIGGGSWGDAFYVCSVNGVHYTLP